MTGVNGFPQERRARGSGIPTRIDIKLPSLGWEFDNSVLLQGGEVCQHWLMGAVEVPYTT